MNRISRNTVGDHHALARPRLSNRGKHRRPTANGYAVSTRPGIRNLPFASTLLNIASGTLIFFASPISAITPSRTMTVWFFENALAVHRDDIHTDECGRLGVRCDRGCIEKEWAIRSIGFILVCRNILISDLAGRVTYPVSGVFVEVTLVTFHFPAVFLYDRRPREDLSFFLLLSVLVLRTISRTFLWIRAYAIVPSSETRMTGGMMSSHSRKVEASKYSWSRFSPGLSVRPSVTRPLPTLKYSLANCEKIDRSVAVKMGERGPDNAAAAISFTAADWIGAMSLRIGNLHGHRHFPGAWLSR